MNRASNPWKSATLVLTGILIGCGAGAAIQVVQAESPKPPDAPKLAVLDVHEAVERSEDGRKASMDLRRFREQQQQEVEARQGELARERKEIDKDTKGKRSEASERRLEEWERKNDELQELLAKFEKELDKKQDELSAPIIEKVRDLTAKVAQKDGYAFVIDKAATPYSTQAFDITKDVILAMNGKRKD